MNCWKKSTLQKEELASCGFLMPMVEEEDKKLEEMIRRLTITAGAIQTERAGLFMC